MAAFSTYSADKILDLILKAIDWDPSGDVYAALFTSGSGLSTNAPTGEVTPGDYARIIIGAGQTVEFTTPTNGSAETDAALVWGPTSNNWSVVTHIALMDALTGGNVLFWGRLPTSKDMGIGETLTLSTGELKTILK